MKAYEVSRARWFQLVLFMLQVCVCGVFHTRLCAHCSAVQRSHVWRSTNQVRGFTFNVYRWRGGGEGDWSVSVCTCVCMMCVCDVCIVCVCARVWCVCVCVRACVVCVLAESYFLLLCVSHCQFSHSLPFSLSFLLPSIMCRRY